jgi:hypothetical protein
VKLTGEKDGKRLRKNDGGIGSASGRPRLKTVILHLFLRAFFSLFSLHCVSFFFCPSFTLSFPLSCSFPCLLPFRFSSISVSFVLFCFLFFFFPFRFCFLCFLCFFVLSLLYIVNNSFFNLSHSSPKISRPLLCLQFSPVFIGSRRRGSPYLI